MATDCLETLHDSAAVKPPQVLARAGRAVTMGKTILFVSHGALFWPFVLNLFSLGLVK